MIASFGSGGASCLNALAIAYHSCTEAMILPCFGTLLRKHDLLNIEFKHIYATINISFAHLGHCYPHLNAMCAQALISLVYSRPSSKQLFMRGSETIPMAVDGHGRLKSLLAFSSLLDVSGGLNFTDVRVPVSAFLTFSCHKCSHRAMLLPNQGPYQLGKSCSLISYPGQSVTI